MFSKATIYEFKQLHNLSPEDVGLSVDMDVSDSLKKRDYRYQYHYISGTQKKF